MNEIKFRALSNGKLYQCHACNFETLNALVDVEGYHSPQWCRVEKFMEYTGLKDKNNIEIYKWDKLLNPIEKIVHLITFDFGCFHWGSIPVIVLNQMDGKLIVHEVIGNAYASPELIK